MKTNTTKRRWVDSMTITVPSRENNDGTTTPAANFRCEVETLKTGAKRIRSCAELARMERTP